jgi:predicted GIY-YIG superfamily endonuclease
MYRHFAADGALLYVGISCKPITRLKQHEHDSGWASEIVRVEIERFETRQAALDAERAAIKKEKPKHNVVHARGQERCTLIKLKFNRRDYTFSSSVELARFLRSRAFDVQRGEMSQEQCVFLLRWVKRNQPALWQRTTSQTRRYGRLSDGFMRTLERPCMTQEAADRDVKTEESVS